MKYKLFKNLSFVIGVIVIVLSIGMFNFVADPYEVFRNKHYMNFYSIPRNYAHILIKAYKNKPCDTVVIGGSNANSLFIFNDFFIYFMNKICMDAFSYKDQYRLLNDYLIFHPETKNVFIFLSYPAFLYDEGIPVSKLKGKKINLKELFFLLFSVETTKKSIFVLKEENKPFNLTDYENNINYLPENFDFKFEYFPNTVPNLHIDEQAQKNLKELNIEYLKKMTELLKEKGIKYKIIILPYHAIFQAMISEVPYMQRTIDELKRISVEIADNEVYDFSVINKYTTSDFENNNFLYTDLIHPNFVMGMKIFKVLHDNISEKNLYVKLNKKNIEQHIKTQKHLISIYDKKNQKLVNKYMNFYENNPKVNINYYEIRKFKNAPDYVTQELDLYRKKFNSINQIQDKGKIIKKGVWKNKI